MSASLAISLPRPSVRAQGRIASTGIFFFSLRFVGRTPSIKLSLPFHLTRSAAIERREKKKKKLKVFIKSSCVLKRLWEILNGERER